MGFFEGQGSAAATGMALSAITDTLPLKMTKEKIETKQTQYIPMKCLEKWQAKALSPLVMKP